jgi:hypothetical protein
MEEEFVGCTRLVKYNVDMLALLSGIQNAKEKQGVDAEDAAVFLNILVEPCGGNNNLKNGDVRGVHALGVEALRVEHEIYVFAKKFHVLEQGGEGFRPVFIGNDEVHFSVF